MDRMKKEKRQQRKILSLDAIGTREERQKFVETLKWMFYEKADDAYHYFIYNQYNKPFLYTCKLLGLKTSGFSCQCHTENERAHRHYIVWIPNPRKVKHPTAQLSQKLKQVMAATKMTRSLADRHCVYGKKIKSRAHLLNTVLYIMTAYTKGRHGGRVVNCKHFGHFEENWVIPDRETMNIFKSDEIDIELPEYAKERKAEWDKYKTDKNYKVTQKDDSEMEDSKIAEETTEPIY